MPKKPKGKSKGSHFTSKKIRDGAAKASKQRQVAQTNQNRGTTTSEADTSTKSSECDSKDEAVLNLNETAGPSFKEQSIEEESERVEGDCESDSEDETAVNVIEIASPLLGEQSIIDDQLAKEKQVVDFVSEDVAPQTSSSEEEISWELVPIKETAEITSKSQKVSDIIVINNILDKSNKEKPWFSMEDLVYEKALELPSTTSVLVVSRPSSQRPNFSPQDANDITVASIESDVKENTSEASRFQTPLPPTPPSPIDKFFENALDPLSTTNVLIIGGPSSQRPNVAAQDANDTTVASIESGDRENISEASRSQTPPPPIEIGTDERELFFKVRESLLLLLPSRWIPIVLHDGIHVGLLSDSKPTLIQRSLYFSSDGNVLASVNGKTLSADHRFWEKVSTMPLRADSTKEFSEFIFETVNRFRSYEVCKGVEEFKEVWKTAPDAVFDNNLFHENRFQSTCRSPECSMIVSTLKIKRCGECAHLWRILSKRNQAREKTVTTSDTVTTPTGKVPYKHLNSGQKRKRMVQKNIEIKRLKAVNARQQAKIEELINKEGLLLDPTTVQDFTAILSDKKYTSKLDEFQKLFIEEQQVLLRVPAE